MCDTVECIKYKYLFSLKVQITLNFMLMNDLVKTELFGLLIENSQEITNEQMQRAYGKFI